MCIRDSPTAMHIPTAMAIPTAMDIPMASPVDSMGAEPVQTRAFRSIGPSKTRAERVEWSFDLGCAGVRRAADVKLFIPAGAPGASDKFTRLRCGLVREKECRVFFLGEPSECVSLLKHAAGKDMWGSMSPAAEVNLPQADRARALIPGHAKYFCFLYPLSLIHI